MRTFLSVLMVVIVSGDDTTIKGVLEGSVLLPCTCLDLDKDFKWQMLEPNPMLMYMYNKTLPNRYKGRTTTFFSENSNNCSVLLANITAEDQGKYKCIYHSEGTYQKSNVYLNVSASYSVCQKNVSWNEDVKVFQCDVRELYREAWIQWTLHGQPLTNSTETKITNANNTDALTGVYYFNSTLITTLNWTSEPTCHVKAKHISITLSNNCKGKIDKRVETPNSTKQVRDWVKIIIVVMFGLSLLLLFSKYRRSS